MNVMFKGEILNFKPISLEYREGGLRKIKLLDTNTHNPIVAFWNGKIWETKIPAKKGAKKKTK